MCLLAYCLPSFGTELFFHARGVKQSQVQMQAHASPLQLLTKLYNKSSKYVPAQLNPANM